MRNSFKKGISKWFLLFLFGFLSVGNMQAQYGEGSDSDGYADWLEAVWDASPDDSNTSYTFEDGVISDIDLNPELDLYETIMDDAQYDAWLADGGYEDKADHSIEDMENPKNHTDDHHVESYSDISVSNYDELYSDLFDPYGIYEPMDNWGDDDQYPPDDDTSSSDDTTTPSTEEATDDPKPDDCPTACKKFYRVKAGTCDCLPEKTWYTDADGDTWFGQVRKAAESPGKGWIEGKPKGQDCDDTKPSVDNICAPVDPCAEIQKQLEDAKFKVMIADLKDQKKLDLYEETGSFQATDGNYYPMEVSKGQPGVLVPYGFGVPQNINHVHQKEWKDPATGIVYPVFPMPSERDIATIYTDYHFARAVGIDLGNNYTGTINSLGYFQLRYTGQSDNLPWEQLKAKEKLIDTEANSDIFKALAKKHGDMIGFLMFMRDTLKITDIALYQVDDTGAKKLELDANNKIKETPCNK